MNTLVGKAEKEKRCFRIGKRNIEWKISVERDVMKLEIYLSESLDYFLSQLEIFASSFAFFGCRWVGVGEFE